MTARHCRGVLLAALLVLGPVAGTAEPARRVLAIGGSVTEIVYALGEQDRLVARDTTSSYPPEATGLPDVGYMRALSPEGVLSVDPDLVVAEEGSGPPEAIDLLREASVDFVTVPEAYDRGGVTAKILAVAEALGVPDKGEALAEKVATELASAEAQADDAGDPMRVLFVLTMQGNRILAAGRETAADGIIRMAGAENAVTGFTGYKPMTDEAIVEAAPDAILMMDRSGDHAAGDDALFGHPAISTTPAAEARRVVRMDGLLLLGFGPRTAEAVTRLSHALHDRG